MKYLFTAILIVIIFFYVLSLFGRLMLRIMIGTKQKEFERAMRDAQGKAQKQRRREGDVYINTPGPDPGKRPISKNVGDYVDYEEVK